MGNFWMSSGLFGGGAEEGREYGDPWTSDPISLAGCFAESLINSPYNYASTCCSKIEGAINPIKAPQQCICARFSRDFVVPERWVVPSRQQASAGSSDELLHVNAIVEPSKPWSCSIRSGQGGGDTHCIYRRAARSAVASPVCFANDPHAGRQRCRWMLRPFMQRRCL